MEDHFFSLFLKGVGREFLLGCAFDLKKLLVSIPRFYEECFGGFVECSIIGKLTEQATCEILHETVIWNNEFTGQLKASLFSRSRCLKMG